MKLSELDLYEIGSTIGLIGAILGDEKNTYLCFFPDQRGTKTELCELDLDRDDWLKLLKQMDTVETEVLSFNEDGKTTKIILRKTQRVIEQRVSWAVYKRDCYECRYCGRDDVPLTVDHLVLWEEGGPSIEKNLVAACRKCNKTRGRTQYAEWLNHPYYLKVSQGLSEQEKAENIAVISSLSSIPRNLNQRSRK